MDLTLILTFAFIILTITLFGAFMVYYQLRSQWFDHRFADLQVRQKHYRLLVQAISESAALGDEESHQKLLTRLDGLTVMASPHMIPKLLEFQKFMRSSNVRVLRNSEFWLEQRDEMSRNLILSLREDIYGYEPATTEYLAHWRPLSRTIRKPGPRFEVIPFKRFFRKPANSEFRQQK
jgi:hypothetical protein